MDVVCRPSYMHFWQLKTFWYEMKASVFNNLYLLSLNYVYVLIQICEDDIELHTYQEISTSPAVSYNDVSSQVKLVVDEMKNFRKTVSLFYYLFNADILIVYTVGCIHSMKL